MYGAGHLEVDRGPHAGIEQLMMQYPDAGADVEQSVGGQTDAAQALEHQSRGAGRPPPPIGDEDPTRAAGVKCASVQSH